MDSFNDTKTNILQRAVLSRLTEERLLELFAQGKLFGTVHTCVGQEFSGSTVCAHLRDGDTIFSNHRCHGHYLSRFGDVDGLIAELMGRTTGVSGGIGGSQHLCKDGFFSNGIQGGIVPVAAGLALGHKHRGAGNISVVFIGDGTLGEGVIYEAFNLASKWQLPLLIVLEDNKYSQSTAQNETLAGDICARAEAFGIEAAKGDTWNWEALHDTAGRLISEIREDSRPRFLQIETYRLKAHSKGDDIRDPVEIKGFEERDPLNLFMGSANPEEQIWIYQLHEEVERAVRKAEQAPAAEFAPPPPPADAPIWLPAAMPASQRLVGSLASTFETLMTEHENLIMIGEDIRSPYGGAFKASKGLSDRFPNRVLNTPISEQAIVGIGSGYGLNGGHAMVEIMFGDFLGLAFDQLVNHAAKFHEMYNYQVMPALTVRTPMGGGRGYGPTHSQTLDRHFVGVPGLRVLALNNLTLPDQLYRPLLQKPKPTLVIENKRLYGSYIVAHPPAGFDLLHSDETFPSAWLRPQAEHSDVTLIGYGGTCEILLAAAEILFEEHDLIAQVICVMQIYPFAISACQEAIDNAPCLLIVEEGQGFAGFGAEIISQLAEAGKLSDLRVARLAAAEHCIPASGSLEAEVLPDAGKIVSAVLNMTR